MLEMVVIADDLTGAADTGVQFCPFFDETVLTSYRNIDSSVQHAESGALSIFTNSRALDADEAGKRLRRVARRLAQLDPKMIYKKVDSSLRGNLGAEVENLCDELGFAMSFIAPAFPHMGRTTIHDIHLIYGTPVAQTELSRDPVTPVSDSRLSHIFRSQCRHDVAHVDLGFLDHTDEDLLGEIQQLAATGVRHLAFDARSDAHLDRIARVAFNQRQKILLVGSAGLAIGVANQLRGKRHAPSLEHTQRSEGHHLLVIGTVSERTRSQMHEVVKAFSYDVMTLESTLLADPANRDRLLDEVRSAKERLSQNHLLVKVASPVERGEPATAMPYSAQQIVRGLGVFVAEMVKEVIPASIFLSGGDTADAVLDAVGARGIRLLREIVPGVPVGTILGGLVEDLAVVTKAGAFGDQHTLVALHRHWMQHEKRC